MVKIIQGEKASMPYWRAEVMTEKVENRASYPLQGNATGKLSHALVIYEEDT